MQNGSYFVPREELTCFMKDARMNLMEGITAFWETDPQVAARILPPPLQPADFPVVTIYAVNIREPTFTQWYMEACLMLSCRFGDTDGVYFLNLQLSGPGAMSALTSGREYSGLPKKLCERIVVERNGDWAHAFVEAKGRRILDVEVEIGADPEMREQARQQREPEHGHCFAFRYETDSASGRFRADLIDYASARQLESWEPARITSIEMEPSLDDPWAELAVVKPLGAAYYVADNWADVKPLAHFEGDDADALFPYLFTGRWDRCTISPRNQRYGQL